MSEAFEGGCACGAVRFRLKSRPLFTHCCHCRDCQRQTGSAFVLNALIETDRIELISGEPKAIAMPSPSGRGHDIYRCSSCLVAVWSDYGKRPYVRFVRVGALDDPSQINPDAHIFARSKLSWVGLPADARVFDVFYNMEEEWPADSKARRRAASEAAKS